MKRELIALCSAWQKQAKKRFEAANVETDIHGKRLLEHSAMIHYNHAQQLLRIVHSKFGFNFIFNVFRKKTKRRPHAAQVSGGSHSACD